MIASMASLSPTEAQEVLGSRALVRRVLGLLVLVAVLAYRVFQLGFGGADQVTVRASGPRGNTCDATGLVTGS